MTTLKFILFCSTVMVLVGALQNTFDGSTNSPDHSLTENQKKEFNSYCSQRSGPADPDKTVICSLYETINTHKRQKRLVPVIAFAMVEAYSAISLLTTAYLIFKLQNSNRRTYTEDFGRSIEKVNRALEKYAPGTYCQRHLVYSSDENKQCSKHRPRRHNFNRPSWMEDFPLAGHHELVAGIRNTPTTQSVPNLPQPFVEVLVRPVDSTLSIPLVIRANITYNDLVPTGNRRNIPQPIYRQMDRMNRRTSAHDLNPPSYDEAGHLLAYALGGGMDNVWNYAPQTCRLNRHATRSDSSAWRYTESYISEFLRENQQGYVNWSLIVIYGNQNLRPIGFGLLYDLVDNYGVRQDTFEECHSNNPVAECRLEYRDFNGLPLR